MRIDSDQTDAATAIAEEILCQVFGEDFTGCSVQLETVASIVSRGLQRAELQDELLGLYEKGIEALHLLSTPPTRGPHFVPETLPALLSERLDSIHELTQKLLEATAACHTRTSLSHPS